jgi:hypothetical protein
MTDEKIDPLDARIDHINEAVRHLSDVAYRMLQALKPNDADQVDIVNTIQAVGVLVGTIVVSLSEIADSVGKIARQNDADFKAAVDAAAAQQAEIIHDETNKRSFIGQPKKGS